MRENLPGSNASVMELLHEIQKNNEEGVRKIINDGFNVNSDVSDPSNGNTNPLLFASSLGKKNMVEILIKAGANIDKQNSSGDTALIAASRIGNIEIVKYLIKAGADIDKQNSSGDTALIAASRIGDIEVVKYLINAGADINKQNSSGDTALIAASRIGDIEVFKYLINAEADLNIENTNKQTASMIAGNNQTFFSEIRTLLSKLETTKTQTQAEGPTQYRFPLRSQTLGSQTLTPASDAPIANGNLVLAHRVGPFVKDKVAQLQSSFAKQPPSIKADLVFRSQENDKEGIREGVNQLLQSAQQSPSGALNGGTQSTVSAQLGFVKSI